MSKYFKKVCKSFPIFLEGCKFNIFRGGGLLVNWTLYFFLGADEVAKKGGSGRGSFYPYRNYENFWHTNRQHSFLAWKNFMNLAFYSIENRGYLIFVSLFYIFFYIFLYIIYCSHIVIIIRILQFLQRKYSVNFVPSLIK